MSRVFVIQTMPKAADISPAGVYGDIRFVLGPSDRTSHNPAIARAKLARGLAEFDPESDYVVWAGGDPLSFFLVGSIFQSMGFAKFRYLRYERGDRMEESSSPYYVPVTVTLED